MAVKEDLSGKRFGRWVVQGKGTRRSTWEVKCMCGNLRDVTRYDLMNGRTKSCGNCRLQTPDMLTWNP